MNTMNLWMILLFLNFLSIWFQDMCNYIAEALNVVLMKPKKVTDILEESSPKPQQVRLCDGNYKFPWEQFHEHMIIS